MWHLRIGRRRVSPLFDSLPEVVRWYVANQFDEIHVVNVHVYCGKKWYATYNAT